MPFGLCGPRRKKLSATDESPASVTCLLKHPISRYYMHLNHDCLDERTSDSPADLVLSRVGSLSLWISPSPPWMSPARSWRIGEGHLEKERGGKWAANHFLSIERALYSSQRKDLPQMYSN